MEQVQRSQKPVIGKSPSELQQAFPLTLCRPQKVYRNLSTRSAFRFGKLMGKKAEFKDERFIAPLVMLVTKLRDWLD